MTLTFPFWQTVDYKAAFEQVYLENLTLKAKLQDAERLADEVAVLVLRHIVGSRSPVADALLDYRNPPRTERVDRLAEMEREIEKREIEKLQIEKLKADNVRLPMTTEFLIDSPHGVDVYVGRYFQGWLIYRKQVAFNGIHWSDAFPDVAPFKTACEAIAAYETWKASAAEEQEIVKAPDPKPWYTAEGTGGTFIKGGG